VNEEDFVKSTGCGVFQLQTVLRGTAIDRPVE